PHASASSWSATSRTQNPPICSLVSRYGPSVTSTLSSGFARRDFAFLAGPRPPTKVLMPAAIISSLRVDMLRTVARSSRDGSYSSGRWIATKNWGIDCSYQGLQAISKILRAGSIVHPIVARLEKNRQPWRIIFLFQLRKAPGEETAVRFLGC